MMTLGGRSPIKNMTHMNMLSDNIIESVTINLHNREGFF